MLRSIISNTEKKENLIITILKFNEERILSTLTSLLEEMEWDVINLKHGGNVKHRQ